MEPRQVISLCSAYGFRHQFTREKEHKMRFQKDTGGFIDLWITRKGMTIGIYNPLSKGMRYVRNSNIDVLETELINYNKHGKTN